MSFQIRSSENILITLGCFSFFVPCGFSNHECFQHIFAVFSKLFIFIWKWKNNIPCDELFWKYFNLDWTSQKRNIFEMSRKELYVIIIGVRWRWAVREESYKVQKNIDFFIREGIGFRGTDVKKKEHKLIRLRKSSPAVVSNWHRSESVSMEKSLKLVSKIYISSFDSDKKRAQNQLIYLLIYIGSIAVELSDSVALFCGKFKNVTCGAERGKECVKLYAKRQLCSRELAGGR